MILGLDRDLEFDSQPIGNSDLGFGFSEKWNCNTSSLAVTEFEKLRLVPQIKTIYFNAR